MTTVFCVRCGDEVPEEELHDALCEACFLEEHEFSLLPEVVDLEACVHCGARRRGEEQWVDEDVPLPEAVRRAVGEALRVEQRMEDPQIFMDVLEEDPRNFTVQVVVDGLVEHVHVREPHTTRVRLKGATCTRCSRFHGGYFESIVQLRRGGDRGVEADEMRAARNIAQDVVERLRAKKGDRNAFILKEEELHGGLDLYIGTSRAGRVISRSIADAYGGRVTDSATLTGQQDGQDVYRVTYSVRLPPYRLGDLVVFQDALHIVRDVGSKHVRLQRLPDLAYVTEEQGDLEDAPVVRREELEEAVVVSHQGGEIQVLDPRSYETVTLEAPPDLPRDLETVQVARHGNRLAVLPPGADAT